MGALIKLILCLYLLSLLFSLFCGLLRFFVDVGKWHDKEKHVKITMSNDDIERGEYNGRNDNTDTGERTGDRTGDTDTGDNTGDNTAGRILNFGN